MGSSLKGRLILIGRDEPLTALGMTLAFEDEGSEGRKGLYSGRGAT